MEAGGAGKTGAADLASGDDGFEPLDQVCGHGGAIITLKCDNPARSITFSACFLEPLKIARKDVDLDIDTLANRQRSQRRVIGGVGNDVDGEAGRAV